MNLRSSIKNKNEWEWKGCFKRSIGDKKHIIRKQNRQDMKKRKQER